MTATTLESSYFNPRLPGGRRPADDLKRRFAELISIHASRVGGDDERS